MWKGQKVQVVTNSKQTIEKLVHIIFIQHFTMLQLVSGLTVLKKDLICSEKCTGTKCRIIYHNNDIYIVIAQPYEEISSISCANANVTSVDLLKFYNLYFQFQNFSACFNELK